LACGPTKKSGKVRRAAKHASPEKRLYGGGATTPVGLASSLDKQELQATSGTLSVRERRAQFVEDPGHHGVLREDIVGEREELQKELDLVRKHSSISLKRFRDIERSRGARSREGLSRWSTRKRRCGQSKARCKHELALDLHTKGASCN
jgi:hypothetical protein